jgi:hypothetical protein
MSMTPNEYIRKLQREASMKNKYGRAVMTVSEQMQEELEPLPEPLPDLGEEAEDEILISTGKIDSPDEKLMECVYKKELGSDFETMDSGVAVGFYDSLPDVSSSEDKPRWYPERELIDFTQDSEYKRLQYLLKSKTRYKRLLKIQARARGEKGEKES